jgi:hypothetical protein
MHKAKINAGKNDWALNFELSLLIKPTLLLIDYIQFLRSIKAVVY